jgi:hypothetical protein
MKRFRITMTYNCYLDTSFYVEAETKEDAEGLAYGLPLHPSDFLAWGLGAKVSFPDYLSDEDGNNNPVYAYLNVYDSEIEEVEEDEEESLLPAS